MRLTRNDGSIRVLVEVSRGGIRAANAQYGHAKRPQMPKTLSGDGVTVRIERVREPTKP